MIRATALGRVGKDSVVRTAGKSELFTFSLACDSGWGDKKQTVWVDVQVWLTEKSKERAERVASFIRKGAQVLIVAGDLSQRDYNDKTYTTLTCQLNDIQITKYVDNPDASADDAVADPEADDGIPF